MEDFTHYPSINRKDLWLNIINRISHDKNGYKISLKLSDCWNLPDMAAIYWIRWLKSVGFFVACESTLPLLTPVIISVQQISHSEKCQQNIKIDHIVKSSLNIKINRIQSNTSETVHYSCLHVEL